MKTSKLSYPLAILDIGSNSVRRMFVNEHGKRDKVTVSTRLGEGLSFSKTLQESAMCRTINAIVTLYSDAVKSGAKSVYAFATAAVRNSDNGHIFVERVKSEIGLAVDVVSGEKEAELSLNGALSGADGGVIDVGGASSEVCFKSGGKISYEYSLPIGAVKLFDGYGRDYAAIKGVVANLMPRYGDIPHGIYKSVGGTATSLAAVDLGLKEYDAELVDGHYICLKRLNEIVDMLFKLSPDEISNKYCIGKKRSDIIAGGGAIIIEILKYAKLDGITVSESDNLEGYLLELGGSL